ncbi:MAG: transposase [Phycisphaerae bacterium]|nr:transposase [Phycisphaerae bacterium]
MTHYRRAFVPGGTFFFTVVTFERRPILATGVARRLLGRAIRATRRDRPFDVVALVLLPDHLHTIWTLPRGDDDFSTRWQVLKMRFTRDLLRAGWESAAVSRSRRCRGEQEVWQRRFWEHRVRDEDDLRRHMDYVHWNPVKHGQVRRVIEWPWSTFHRYVRLGVYPPDWGAHEPLAGIELTTSGE